MMYRPSMMRQALRLGLLVTLVVLALSACGETSNLNKAVKLRQKNPRLPIRRIYGWMRPRLLLARRTGIQTG